MPSPAGIRFWGLSNLRDQEAVGSNPVTPTKKPFVPYPGTNGFFVLECRGFEQPVPAAAGRKSARWAVCEGAGESRHPTGATLYRIPVQTAFLSWSAEGSNSPTPPQRGANQPGGLFARARENPVTRPAQPCTVSRYKRLFCLGVTRVRTARPRRSGAQISPVVCVKIVAIM